MLNVQFYKRIVYTASPTQQRVKRTSVQWTAIRWTAGQQETRWGVTTCICMHPHLQVFRRQCSAQLVKPKSKGLIWQRDDAMDEEDTWIPCCHGTFIKGKCKSKSKNCDSELIQMNNAHHQLQDWSCSTSPMSPVTVNSAHYIKMTRPKWKRIYVHISICKLCNALTRLSSVSVVMMAWSGSNALYASFPASENPWFCSTL